jgi:hypothetical protein
LIAQLLELPDRKLIRAFIGLANDAVTQIVTKPKNFENEGIGTFVIPNEVRIAAEILFERFAAQSDLKLHEIKERMLSIEPFVHYPSVIDDLIGELHGR